MMQPKRQLGVVKQVLFSLLTVGGLLILLNGLVEFADREGVIETTTRDDAVQYLDQPLFERTEGDWYETTHYARSQCVPSRFAADKGDTFRAFLLGGSFAMGTPFVHQGHNEERPGGMATTIRKALTASGTPHEVLNVAAGAQNSSRVREIAREVATYDPDVLIVATCNNEGVLPPTVVEQGLHESGLYRLVSRGVNAIAPDERSLYTPQDPDTNAVRDAFRENLRDIIRSAENVGVPVLLCTLPVNLRYEDQWVGHVIERFDWQPGGEQTACVEQLKDYFYSKHDYLETVRASEACDSVEALRMRGLALMALGRSQEATHQLEQYTEVMPRNRCRPSFNEVIREEAARAEHVHLVDLDAHARRESPNGVPGEELFVDYCHMNERGYELMAEEIVRVMRATGIYPE